MRSKKRHPKQTIEPIAKRKNKKGASPPNKDIDIEELKVMARFFCTMGEMADCLGITEKTLKQNYHEMIKKARSWGRADLRKAQAHKAIIQQDTQMLKWLGIQYLDQGDRFKVQRDDEQGFEFNFD